MTNRKYPYVPKNASILVLGMDGRAVRPFVPTPGDLMIALRIMARYLPENTSTLTVDELREIELAKDILERGELAQ